MLYKSTLRFFSYKFIYNVTDFSMEIHETIMFQTQPVKHGFVHPHQWNGLKVYVDCRRGNMGETWCDMTITRVISGIVVFLVVFRVKCNIDPSTILE